MEFKSKLSFINYLHPLHENSAANKIFNILRRKTPDGRYCCMLLHYKEPYMYYKDNMKILYIHKALPS